MGLVIPQKVEICWCGALRKHLLSLGYNDMKYRDKRLVDILDLPDGSAVIVKAVCDYCGEETDKMWKSIQYTLKTDNPKIACSKCVGNKYAHFARKNIESKTDINTLYWDQNWLREQYITKSRTAADIALECKVNTVRIEKYLSRYGIQKLLDYELLKQDITENILRDLYEIQLFSIQDISDKFNIGKTYINNLMKEYGIEIRSNSEYMKKYYLDETVRENKSKFFRSLWENNDYRKKMEKRNNERKNDMGRRIRFSAKYQGISIDEWNGFLTPERLRIRNSIEFKNWRDKVYKRDNYTCQCCGNRSSKGNPVTLNAHHKENFADNPDLRFDISNGVTLCKKCHHASIKGSFHNTYGCKRNNTEQLNEYIANKQKEKAG